MDTGQVATQIPFARPDITDEDIQGVVEVLREGWLTTGRRVKAFEEKFANAVGARHALAVNSCTAAMHLALDALRIGPGDEVIVPTLTFTSTAEVVRYVGATPVLVDVNPGDHNISAIAVQAAITPRTRAVIPVHFAGQPCDVDEIAAIAQRVSAYTVADSAHCFPGTYRGRPVGLLADISCFSFYATKTITTGEGGAAVTENDQWAERMSVMSLHGISGNAWKRYASDGHWYYEVLDAGFKYNLTEIAGSLGLSQLARSHEMLSRRAYVAHSYDTAFGTNDALELLEKHPDRTHAHHLYVVKLRPGTLRIDRDEFIRRLAIAGVGASVHFIPLHMQPYYSKTFGYGPEAMSVARDLYLRSISLPIYSTMPQESIDRVCEVVTTIVDESRR